MHDTNADNAVTMRRAECERLIAAHIARALAAQGIAIEASELIANPDLRSRDLALLGLGSLDWMTVATQLEDATGVELPDSALVEQQLRCVSGWTDALLRQGELADIYESGPRLDENAAR